MQMWVEFYQAHTLSTLEVLRVTFVTEAFSHYFPNEPLHVCSQHVNEWASLREAGGVVKTVIILPQFWQPILFGIMYNFCNYL